MFVVNSYSLAVIFCFITMLCWGSWGNTQKLAGKTWRYELFYWDYVIGMVLFAILLGFTMGSIGTEGRPFLEDLAQAEWGGIGSVVLGGVIFNASNILLSASVSLAGLSVAFPLGVGLALVLGVIVNYVGAPVSYREYFRGSLPTHLVGMLGGAVWCLGTAFSYIAAGKAGAAISYALGQGAPMIAAVWGVFIWKEFKGADRKTNTLLAVMFLFFIAGLASIIASGGN